MSTTGPLWRELPVYRAFLHISQIPHKNSLNIQFFPSVKGNPPHSPKVLPLWKQTPISGTLLSIIFQSPQYTSPLPGFSAGPLWREMPVSRAFLYTSSRVPSKGSLPSGSPHRAPTEKDAPFLEPSLTLWGSRFI